MLLLAACISMCVEQVLLLFFQGVGAWDPHLAQCPHHSFAIFGPGPGAWETKHQETKYSVLGHSSVNGRVTNKYVVSLVSWFLVFLFVVVHCAMLLRDMLMCLDGLFAEEDAFLVPFPLFGSRAFPFVPSSASAFLFPL